MTLPAYLGLAPQVWHRQSLALRQHRRVCWKLPSSLPPELRSNWRFDGHWLSSQFPESLCPVSGMPEPPEVVFCYELPKTQAMAFPSGGLQCLRKWELSEPLGLLRRPHTSFPRPIVPYKPSGLPCPGDKVSTAKPGGMLASVMLLCLSLSLQELGSEQALKRK